MRLTAGLAASDIMRPLPAPYNGEEQRFEQRFGFMHHLAAPEPLFYHQYAENMAGDGAAWADLFIIYYLYHFSNIMLSLPLVGGRLSLYWFPS